MHLLASSDTASSFSEFQGQVYYRAELQGQVYYRAELQGQVYYRTIFGGSA
jgi:hypothetical protein